MFDEACDTLTLADGVMTERATEMSASGRLGLVIGVKKGRLLVIRTTAGSPAHRAGLLAGDHVVRIDQDDTAGMDRKAAAARLAGPPGAPVVLWIARAGANAPVRFDLVREAGQDPAMPAGIGKFFLGLAGVLVVVGIIVAIAVRSNAPHRDGAIAYAKLVRESQPRAAYELLATERRQGLPYDAWLLSMNTPLLGRAKDVSVSSTQSSSVGHGCVRTVVESDEGTVALTFYTLAEGDQIRIHSVMTNEEQSGLVSRAPWSCN